MLTREVLQSVIEQDEDLARVFGVEFVVGGEGEEEDMSPPDSPNLEVGLK